ncbi:MAG: hypothetical protein HN757_01995 [Calditrichaeota bacterium]|nr:hypothetical protein [Calditrichota bacterium]
MKQKSFNKLSLVAVLLLFGISNAAVLPGYFELDSSPDPEGRLPSNSIIDIIPDDGTLWMGTSRGIAQYYLGGQGWFNIRSGDAIGTGGISALTVSDSIIWAATAFSEKTSAGTLPAGGGVGYSRNGGEDWIWLPQPVDPVDTEDYAPTTTNVQNVTYDIALSQESVWITSWGGGLRRLRYGSEEWELVTVDGQSFTALHNLNHRGFSVIYVKDALWVGTAGGISRSIDEGLNWEAFAFHEDPGHISGNFVTALAAQKSPTIPDHFNIWAATWKANDPKEYYGLSVSENDGASWRIALSDSTELQPGEYLIDRYGPLHVHNIGFGGDSTVYAAADGALWFSQDLGHTWAPLDEIYDPTTGENFRNVDFFSAVWEETSDAIWVGTNAGLAEGRFNHDTGTFSWRIHRSFKPAGVDGTPNTYAYPSPFSPKRGQLTRFQVPASSSISAELKIMNFNMESVYSSGSMLLPGGGTNEMSGYGAIQWDGRDSDGDLVANGVYFYRVKVGSNTWWGKVMVLD